MINLNVSGKKYEISREVLSRSQLFAGLLADCPHDNKIMIERSPKLFEHVLAYLFDNKYPYPMKYYPELDYYLISYEKSSLYDANDKIKQELDLIKRNLVSMYNKIDSQDDKEYDVKCEYSCCYETCMKRPKPMCPEHTGLCCHVSERYDGGWKHKICNKQIGEYETLCAKHLLDD